MLSQTVEYALRAMIHLASIEGQGAVTSESIAERTKVPRTYLSKILRDLTVAELVHSQRGPNGGFVLARTASRITMLDVVEAVDPIPRIRRCPLGNPAHLELCPLHRRLDDAAGMVEEEFRRTTLAEVLETSVKAKGQCRAIGAPTVRR